MTTYFWPWSVNILIAICCYSDPSASVLILSGIQRVQGSEQLMYILNLVCLHIVQSMVDSESWGKCIPELCFNAHVHTACKFNKLLKPKGCHALGTWLGNCHEKCSSRSCCSFFALFPIWGHYNLVRFQVGRKVSSYSENSLTYTNLVLKLVASSVSPPT